MSSGPLWSQSANYVGEVENVLANSISGNPRKVFDGVLTNEMALQRPHFKTDTFDFEVGELIPGLTSSFNQRLYNPQKEYLAMMIREIYLDVEIKFFDVVNYYSSRFTFLDDGGTDSLLVYLIDDYLEVPNKKGISSENFIVKDGIVNWEKSNIAPCYIMPLIYDHVQYGDLMKSTILDSHIDFGTTTTTDKMVSFIAALRYRFIESIKGRMNKVIEHKFKHYDLDSDGNKKPWKTAADGTLIYHYQEYSRKYRIIGFDFMNAIHTDLVEGFQKTSGNPIEVESWMNQGKQIYKSKSTDGALTLNEFGHFIACLFRCPPGIFFPLDYYSQSHGNFVSRLSLDTMKISASILTSWHKEGLEVENSHSYDTERYFPQNYNPEIHTSAPTQYIIPTNAIKNWGGRIGGKPNPLIFRLLPYFWIAHKTTEPLSMEIFLDQVPPGLGKAIQSYCSYSATAISASLSYEPPVDFSSLFGSCNLFIDQCRSLRHNVRNQSVTAMIKFVTHLNTLAYDGISYKPELMGSQNMNIWDEMKRETGVKNTPLRVRVLSEKFGSVPPTITNSKLVVCAAFYAYRKK